MDKCKECGSEWDPAKPMVTGNLPCVHQLEAIRGVGISPMECMR
jgi:hypothetical protein